jgi:hypothetical protein
MKKIKFKDQFTEVSGYEIKSYLFDPSKIPYGPGAGGNDDRLSDMEIVHDCLNAISVSHKVTWESRSKLRDGIKTCMELLSGNIEGYHFSSDKQGFLGYAFRSGLIDVSIDEDGYGKALYDWSLKREECGLPRGYIENELYTFFFSERQKELRSLHRDTQTFVHGREYTEAIQMGTGISNFDDAEIVGIGATEDIAFGKSPASMPLGESAFMADDTGMRGEHSPSMDWADLGRVTSKFQAMNRMLRQSLPEGDILAHEMDDSGSVVATTLIRENRWPYHDIATTPPPEDVQVIVRLEEPTLGGLYHIARFGRLPLIAGFLAGDMPKPTHWAYIPNFKNQIPNNQSTK